ncbi:MAG: alanine racemase [Rhodocyclaceae bacterium]|nr:alanine racemase [Rhodocyclaceae bacterium]
MSQFDLPVAGARLCIDLDAVCDNWRLLRARVGGANCAAVVKADAYGLGAERVAPALQAAGCRHFFVAHLGEGLRLREVLGGGAQIFVLHGVHPGAEAECAGGHLTPVLNSLAQVAAWQGTAARAGRALPAVLQVDTGMARLGMEADEWALLAATPGRLAGINVRFMMSHLVSAEDPADPTSGRQLARFQTLRERMPGLGASLANSSGIFLGPDYHFDLVRPGAALYGLAPVRGQANPMRPVIRLQGQVLQIRSIAAGTPVGYSHTWVATRESRIATVAVGYADGYLRSLGNRGRVSFEGQQLPVVGTVSMDTITVDATEVPRERLGEGSLIDLADPENDADAIADRASTIGYEILTGLGRRYARCYLGGGEGPRGTEAIGKRAALLVR